jgi:radical SAM superfamily enzyme YgiQ (UPF0313 family)
MADRLDVLFIYPPWPVLDDRAVLQNSLPPLGILSIAAYLESVGRTVRVCDVHGEKLDEGEVRRRLREHRPRHVGISVLTNMAIPAHKLARLCKEEVPDCVVVVGGVHAEAMPESMLKNSAIDAVCRGDGEELMREVVDGEPFAAILGLSYREGEAIRHNPPRPVEMNLDRYPFPAYHLVDFKNYFPAVGSYRNLPAINMLMTRGCPGKCTFCNSARTTLRSRDPARVVEQIRLLRERHGIRQVQFYDDTFTVVKKLALEFCERLTAADLGVTWTAYIRGDCFSDDLARAMKRAGCHQVLIGIETGNAAIAARIGKPIDRERYRETVRIAHAHGLEVRGSFIIGNMDETWQSMEDTLRYAVELDVDLFQLSISTPYPGSALFNEAAAKGWLRHRNWYAYGQGEVLVDQPQLGAEDIYRFERHAFRSFYLRPRAAGRMLARVANLRHLRDYALAAAVLLLGKHRKGGGVADKWACWRGLTEEQFFDVALGAAQPLRLTYVLRQEQVAPSR